MNRIQQINNFIRDYDDLSPYLQEICRFSLEHYKRELIKELLVLSNHPHPEEYLGVNASP